MRNDDDAFVNGIINLVMVGVLLVAFVALIYSTSQNGKQLEETQPQQPRQITAEFSYTIVEEHRYIVFYRWGFENTCSVVHDPNCPACK